MKIKLSRKDFLKRMSIAFSVLPFAQTGNLFANTDTASLRFISKTLGRTGIKVNTVGIGASRTQEPAIIKAAMDAGVNFFDTGRRYANGKNEEMLGKVFKGIRHEVVIQSKVKIPQEEDLIRNKRVRSIIRKMNESVEESLKALQTDYIDIMLLHGVRDPEISSHPAIMEFMDKLKTEGKILAHGFSCHNNQAEMIRKNNESVFYDVVMPAFNHRGGYVHSNNRNNKYDWDQEALIKVLKEAHEKNTGIVAMKTTSGGPYKDPETGTESFTNAVRWVVTREYISVAAVAMANFNEINENVKAMIL